MHVGLLPPVEPNLYCAKFSAAEFFKDSPWLQIPKHRRGEILIEPLHPRGGLLGGTSSASGPKVSKLAALAAARKKKENNHHSGDTTQNMTSSVALLDRLSGKTNATKTVDESPPKPNTPRSEITPQKQPVKPPDRKYPVRRRRSSNPSAHVEAGISDLQDSGAAPLKTDVTTPAVAVPAASPSIFAQTILGSSEGTQKASTYFPEPSNFFIPLEYSSNTELDSFAGPSPDDVVIKAQNSKGSTRKIKEV